MPTTICCTTPTCGCTAICIAATTIWSSARNAAPTRVVCQARGLDSKGEAEGYDPGKLIEI